MHDPAERARFSAVVGILGMLLVPFVHLSVYLFRTLHPQPIVLKPSAPSLPARDAPHAAGSTLVFTVLYVGFVTARYGLSLAEEAREDAAMPVEPPQNGEYLVAAYVIAATILMGYWVMLWRKARRGTKA